MTQAAFVHHVDLNCDLGEGAPNDAALMPLITSANIAAGGHAGDEATIHATVALAKSCGVAVGAHPGFEDRAHFGRRELDLAPEVIRAMVARQVSAVRAACAAAGVKLAHVKPHGGLYTLAVRDAPVAAAVVGGVVDAVGRGVRLYAPSAGELFLAAGEAGLLPVAEAFADRTYQPDGRLTPRTRPDALITEVGAAVAQVLGMLRHGMVRSTEGDVVPIRAETVCVHGDGAHAVEFATGLRAALASAGVRICAPGSW